MPDNLWTLKGHMALLGQFLLTMLVNPSIHLLSIPLDRSPARHKANIRNTNLNVINLLRQIMFGRKHNCLDNFLIASFFPNQVWGRNSGRMVGEQIPREHSLLRILCSVWTCFFATECRCKTVIKMIIMWQDYNNKSIDCRENLKFRQGFVLNTPVWHLLQHINIQ